MTTQAILDATIESQLPTNGIGLITAAILRPVLHQMVAFTQQQSTTTAGPISVAALNPPVLANGTDQAANLQAAIDTYSASGGATIQFGAGTYLFNSSIILKPNVVLRGLGIDITILKVGVDNITLVDLWGSGTATGSAGIEDLTAWGFNDRNGYTQQAAPLLQIGPFAYYWYRNVKAIYSANMSIKGRGTVGIVDHCVVIQSLRDGINLTGTTYVEITNNDISMVGDDAIAYHLANGTTGVNDCAAVIIGNRISKSFGIKLLGVRNATVQGNDIRFYGGYGINIGLDNSFNEGLITRFSISVTGNTILDGLNANRFGPNIINYGIFLHASMSLGSGGTAIPVNVGQYLSGPKAIQTPDAFINQAGPAQPRGQDGNISIVSNDIRQTLGPATHFSDYGFGTLWYSSGPVDPVVSPTLIGEMSGISFHDDMENLVVSSNTMHGLSNGVEVTGQLNNTIISGNTFFRLSGNGVSMITGSLVNGSVAIDRNIFDMDPYLEAPTRTAPIDGSWTANDGSSLFGVLMQRYNGVSITRNRFRNCLRCTKGITSGNYITKDNIVEFDWISSNSGAGNSGIGSVSGVDPGVDIFWFCNSDPRSVNFNQYDQDFVISTNSIPTVGAYYRGTFVRNSAPSLDGNSMVIWGWIRLTTGNANVSGTDWAVARVSHTSPAV